MTPPQHKVTPGWEDEDAEASILELDALLKSHGVVLAHGTPFSDQVLEALTLVERTRAKPPRAEDEDLRQMYRALIGVHELATVLLTASRYPGFTSLIPHLQLLNQGKALQNVPSSARDGATNKVFELMLAGSAAQFATNVELDHPVVSKGTNPDVLFTHRGRRWGVACKVLHGSTPQGFCDRLIEGLDQIDRSEAEVGIVVFNLKNVIPHDEIWPLAELDGIEGNPLTTAGWTDSAAPFTLLRDFIDDFAQRLLEYLPPGHLETMFVGRKSVPGFLFWGASPSAIILDGKPTSCSVRIPSYHFATPVDGDDKATLTCLTWGLFPDTSGRPPCPC